MSARGGADRAAAMARRLDRTARRLGVAAEGRSLMRHALGAAMEPRRDRIREDHHPDYLHPARTALILMDDAAVADPRVLAVALLAETRDRSLAVSRPRAERLAPGLAAELDRIPAAGREPEEPGDRLLETLLALPADVALVAVAERLDHARHLHLRERDEWAAYHAITCGAYAPVAARVHPVLGRRLAWWCETFERRFLRP